MVSDHRTILAHEENQYDWSELDEMDSKPNPEDIQLS